MSEDKYIGLDVHQTSVSVAVLDREGKLTMEHSKWATRRHAVAAALVPRLEGLNLATDLMQVGKVVTGQRTPRRAHCAGRCVANPLVHLVSTQTRSVRNISTSSDGSRSLWRREATKHPA
jgi:hypothetical protein